MTFQPSSWAYLRRGTPFYDVCPTIPDSGYLGEGGGGIVCLKARAQSRRGPESGLRE